MQESVVVSWRQQHNVLAGSAGKKESPARRKGEAGLPPGFTS